MTLLHQPTDHKVVPTRKALIRSLDSINKEISCLQDRLSMLSLEQRQLHASLESYKGLLSPIHQLLPEILQEIFCHCLPTAHNAVMSAMEAPLVLGRVCSRWRRVAYSTPELWASIHIVVALPPHPTSPQAQQAIALQRAVAAWLSRSGALPLSISLAHPTLVFYQRRNPARILIDQVRYYLDLIAPYAHRWRLVHFTVLDFCWTEFFDRFHALDVPLLESLHIDGSHCSRPMQQDIFPAISAPTSILHAPQLRVLSTPFYPIPVPKSGAQLQNLTGLNITDFCPSPSQDIIQILGLCPNLRKCAIGTSVDPWGDDFYVPFPTGPVPTMIIPKLQSLAISGTVESQYLTKLLNILVTPSLRHLLIPRPPQDASESDHLYDSLSSFLLHLINPLEELDLSYGVPGRNPASILSLVPGLKRLSLDARLIPSPLAQPGFRVHDPILLQLTPDNNQRGTPGSPPGDEPSYHGASTCLCPKLEVLRYVNGEFPDNELLDFLRSRTMDYRRNDVSHLRMVSVHFHRLKQDDFEEMDLDLPESIKVLERETGVRVDCRYKLREPVQGPFVGGPANMGYSPFDGTPL